MFRAAPFALIAPAFAAGVWLTTQFPLPIWVLVAALAGALAVWRIGARAAAALIGLIALGALRTLPALPPARAASLGVAEGHSVAIDGVVDDDPDARPAFTYLRIRITRILADLEDVSADRFAGASAPDLSGVVLVRADPGTAWRYGDAVRVLGVLEAPPLLSDFDYRDYLARKGILAWMPRTESLQRTGRDMGNPLYAALMAARSALRLASQRSMPSPESALLTGILIGDDNEIPPLIQEAFRRTGTSHIVAISGFNVSIVIALVVPALSRLLNPRRAAIVAIPAILAYTVMVGGSASVVRAAGMALIGLVGQLLWRRGFTVNTLCAGAGAMLAGDPLLLFDGGFQLSCSATLGLALYSDAFQRRATAWVEARVSEGAGRRFALSAAEPLLTTLAAQVTTLPLILANFHQVSFALPITNTLVLPLQSGAMILGLAAAGIGLISTELARWVALPAYALLTATLRVVEATSQLPFAAIPVFGFETPAALGYVLGVGALSVVGAQPVAFRKRLRAWLAKVARPGAITLAVLIGLIVGAVTLLQRPDGRLHVTLAGTGAYIQTPEGRQVVYSGGGALLPVIGRAMPLFDREIDLFILPDRTDNARGTALPYLQRYRIGALAQPPPSGQADEPTEMLDAWTEAVGLSVGLQRDTPAGTRIELEPGLTLTLETRAGGGLRARLSHGPTVFELAGSGDLTDGALTPNAIVFAAGRARDAAPILTAEPPRWLVWADAGAPPISGIPAAFRAIRLRDAGVVEFVSDGKTVVRVR